MADVQYWEDTLRDEIDDINDILEDAKDERDAAERSSLLVRAEKKLRSAQGTKRSFKMETRLVNDPSTRRKFENRLSKLDDELKTAINDLKTLQAQSNRNELFVTKRRNGNGNDDDGEYDDDEGGGEVDHVKAGSAMLDECHNIQDKTQQSLNRTKQLVAESKEVGVATLEELEKQREQIERIDGDVNRIDDNLSRAQKLIKHFGKRMASDKFIQCFAVINVLLLVGVVLFAIFRGGSLGSSERDGGSPLNPFDRKLSSLLLLSSEEEEATADGSSGLYLLRGTTTTTTDEN